VNRSSGNQVIYPTEQDILDFFAKLPEEVQDEFELLEKAHGNYRRVFQQFPGDERKRIERLCEIAGTVFKTQASKRLRAHSGTFEDFQRAVGLDGGDAERGFWYAHRLYNLAERGRMLAIWARQIQSYLWERIEEAENMWYTPYLVPVGWKAFFGAEAGVASDEMAPSSVPLSAVPPSASGSTTPQQSKPETAGGLAPASLWDGEDASGNKAIVNDFICTCFRETGVKVTRTMIWRAAGYRNRTEFERWQASHPKATPTANQNFRRLLSMAPTEFIAILTKHGIPS
jgi:hypothetical protein